MEALKNALAELVAAESRGQDLVDAAQVLDQRTRALAKENAIAILELGARVEQIAHAPAIESDVPATPLPLATVVTTGPSGSAGPFDRTPDVMPDPKIAGELPGSAAST